MKIINKIKNIIKDDNFNSTTTETKILKEIENILEKWPIDNIKTKDDFIRFIFNIYFYKSKYRPFVSYLEIIFRYYLIVIVIVLVWISLIHWLLNYGLITTNNNIDLFPLWLLISNIAYFSIPFYIIVRIYSYIRKLLRNEINKHFWYVITIGTLKIISIIWLIALSWFIWQFIASILLFLFITFKELMISISI